MCFLWKSPEKVMLSESEHKVTTHGKCSAQTRVGSALGWACDVISCGQQGAAACVKGWLLNEVSVPVLVFVCFRG